MLTIRNLGTQRAAAFAYFSTTAGLVAAGCYAHVSNDFAFACKAGVAALFCYGAARALRLLSNENVAPEEVLKKLAPSWKTLSNSMNIPATRGKGTGRPQSPPAQVGSHRA